MPDRQHAAATCSDLDDLNDQVRIVDIPLVPVEMTPEAVGEGS